MEQQMKTIADAVNEIMRQTLADRDEIERLRKALQLIAAPSKVVVKGEEAVVALRLVLSSHRRTARKALGEKE